MPTIEVLTLFAMPVAAILIAGAAYYLTIPHSR